MEHPGSIPSPELWRAAAMVAAAVATVELFILVTLGVAFGSKFLAGEAKNVVTAPINVQTQAPVTETPTQAAEPAKTKTAEPAAKPSILARKETSVIVLNGNGVSGAAAIAAEQVRRHQYLIAGTDNAPRTSFARSIVMYRPGYEAEGRRLADDLKLKRIVPLDGMRARDLQGAHLAYIIGG